MLRRNRPISRSLLLAPVLAVTSLIFATSATAAPDRHVTTPDVEGSDLVCVMSGSASVSPGVSLLPETQEVSINLQGGTAVTPATPCTSATGVPYQGFTAEATGSGEFACSLSGLGEGVSGTGVVTWDNGDTSTVEWSLTTAVFVPVVDIQITDGPLSGSTFALGGIVPTGITGNCVLNPITGFGFAGASVAISALG